MYEKLKYMDVSLVPCGKRTFNLVYEDQNIIDGATSDFVVICFTQNNVPKELGYLCEITNDYEVTPVLRIIVNHEKQTLETFSWYDLLVSDETQKLVEIICNMAKIEVEGFHKQVDAIDELADKMVPTSQRAAFHFNSYDAALMMLINILNTKQSPYEKLPKDVKQAIDLDIEKLNSVDTPVDEKRQITSYLQVVTSIPWGSIRNIISTNEEILAHLDSSHFGLHTIKSELVEFLSVYRESCHIPKTILLAGPPNVGKTSLVRSLATGAGLAHAVVPMGGMTDLSILLGFNRSYRDSQVGRVIKSLIVTKCMNPIIILDEIDKTSEAVQNQLLHILDPEHRDLFVDTYLGFPVDLSNCIFLATANDTSKISDALLRRLMTYNLQAYTLAERCTLIKDFVWPRMASRYGAQDIQLLDSVITTLAKDSFETGILEDTLFKLLARAKYTKVSVIDDVLLSGVTRSSDLSNSKIIGF